jgi:hypothetical protein
MTSVLSAKLAKNINYLAVTPMEQLYDDGVKFEGVTEKEQNLNHDDFVAARAIYTQMFNGLSEDGRAFLLRSLRLTIKSECFD